jgi:hypothetical protein
MATPANQIDTDEVLYDVADHVATITINRPDAQNTISGPMLDALTQRLLEANENNDVRAIIVTGSGRFFCAGLDLRGGGIAGGLSSQGAGPANLDLRNTPPTVLHSLDTPTICALNGSAAGYGMDLALGCDIRIMADSAKMAAAFTARGVVPESGGTWILPRLLGWSKAAEIIFTGRTLLADDPQPGTRDRRQCASGRAGLQADDADGHERDVQRPRPPRVPAAAATFPLRGFPRRDGFLHGEAQGRVQGTVAASRPGACSLRYAHKSRCVSGGAG